MRPREIHAYAASYLPTELALVQSGGYATAHPELTPAEKALVYHYTDTGSGALNRALHQHGGIIETTQGYGLAATLTKMPAYKGPAYSAALWNSVDLAVLLRKAASGDTPFNLDIVRWPAFLSASRSLAVAQQHLNYSPKNCLLIISSKTGRHIEALSRYGPNGPDPAMNEREILFLPGTRFEVVAVRPATSFAEIELLEL